MGDPLDNPFAQPGMYRHLPTSQPSMGGLGQPSSSLAPAIPSMPGGVQDPYQAKLWKAIGDQYRRGASGGGNQFLETPEHVQPGHQTMTPGSGPQAQFNSAQHGDPQYQGNISSPQAQALTHKLESLLVRDLEVRAANWRESMPALEARVQELMGIASRPGAPPEIRAAYDRTKNELEQNKFLLIKAQEIIDRKHAQARNQVVQTQGQAPAQARAAAQLAPALDEPVRPESSLRGPALGRLGRPSQPGSLSTPQSFSPGLPPYTRPTPLQPVPSLPPDAEQQSQQPAFPQNGRQTKVIPHDRTAFMHLIRQWFIQTGRNVNTIPKIGDEPVDLHQLYIEVEALGGVEKVQATGLWRLVAVKMGYMMYVTRDSQLTQIAQVFAGTYTTVLVPFESYCLEWMRAANTGIQSNQLNQMDHTWQNAIGADQILLPGPRQGSASITPDGEAAAVPTVNLQRVIAFLQVTLKDWLPELPLEKKLLRAAQMDLPMMQSEGWSADRIQNIQRFRPALLHFHASDMHQQHQALGQLSRSESAISTLSENTALTERNGGKEDENAEPINQSESLTKDLPSSERELGRNDLGAENIAENPIVRGKKRRLEGRREQDIEERGTALKRGKIIRHDYVDMSPNRMGSPICREHTTESTVQDLGDSACDAQQNADAQSGQISCEELFQRLVDHGCVDLSAHMDPERYSSGLIIGGAFGDIWKGKLRDGTEVAIKVWRFSSLLHNGWKTMKRAMREIYYWSKANHEYVQELMGVIMFQGRLGMVSRWMEHGNLREYICKSPSVDRYALCMQVATGIAYLHSQEMIHGDLKGTNILVSDDGVAKLSDFDHSIMSDCSLAFSETSKMGGGTTRWMAPELIIDNNCNRNAHTDVYALGMTMLEIITGNSPYYPQFKTDVSVMWAVVKKTLPIRPMDHLGDNTRDDRMWELLLSCWNYDPLARPKAAEVVASLQIITTLPPMGGPA